MRAISFLGPTLLLSLVVASTACQTVAPDDNNPFATAPPMSSAPPTNDTGDETETGGSSSSSSGGAETSTGPAMTTEPLDTGTSLPPLTTGMSMEDSTTSGGGGTGVQPNSGIWMP